MCIRDRPGTVSIGHGEWSKFDNVRKSKLMPYGIDEAGNCNLLIGEDVYKRQGAYRPWNPP